MGTPKILFAALTAAVIATGALFLVPDRRHERSMTFRAQKEHPVTPAMTAAAAALSKKVAPDFRLDGLDGKPWTLSEASAGKPLLIFFVEKECPCCLGAKPFLDRVYRRYRDVLSAVAVINADRETASLWSKTVGGDMRVLCDPTMTVIRDYSAERGVYSTLVDKDGRIAAAYPGYSKSMLIELGSLVAKLGGVPDRELDTRPAPEKLTSGCSFPLD